MAGQKAILFTTDFSHAGDAAFAMAESIAKDRGAKLIITHVEEPLAVYGGGDMYYGIPEPDIEVLREMLNNIVPSDTTLPHEHRMIVGAPAQAIVQLADDEGVELIVMGTHGRSGISRLLMGSVAEAVVRHANCPVLTYRQPEGSATTSN